jgi:hypothetical protein
MGLTLAQMAEGLLPLHVRRSVLAEATGYGPHLQGKAVDWVTARSLASVGLTGMLGLPFLILASLVLEVPLAGPAVIALGYIATAEAIAAHQERRATVWTLAVLLGFVGWTLVILLSGEAPLSWPALAAALPAPILAAAPAFARHLILARSAPAKAVAGERAACLNQPGSKEAVLVPDRNGATLADIPAPRAPAPLSPPDALRSAAAAGKSGTAAAGLPEPTSNVGEAIAFALQQIGARAIANGVTLVHEAESDVMAACDTRTCRRIVSMLAASAVRCSATAATVRVMARNVSHAMLLRVSLEAAADDSTAAKLRNALNLTDVGGAIDRAGGSIIVENCDAGATVSVRLPRGAAARPNHFQVHMRQRGLSCA